MTPTPTRSTARLDYTAPGEPGHHVGLRSQAIAPNAAVGERRRVSISTANDLGLLTIDEACERLAISKSLLRDQLLKRQLSVVRLGRRLFIPPQTLDDLVRIGRGPFRPHVRKEER